MPKQQRQNNNFSSPSAESARIRYAYRRKILHKELDMPIEEARKLIGPDCAYHLYRYLESDYSEEE